jgi:hypothetical protein
MVAWSIPAFAQSNTVRMRDTPDVVLADAALSADGVARPYEGGERASILELPGNIAVAPHLLPLVEAMLRDSSGFRRQALRIANASDLTVSIRTIPDQLPGARARTRFSTDASGRRRAVVVLVTGADPAELIAHDLEHIIEQLDGIDLAARAKHPGSGIRRCAGGAFETERAIQAGRAIAEEMQRSR